VFCKGQGIECVAEQLLASLEGLFSVTMVVIYCNDLTVVVLRMNKTATVLPALTKVCTIPFHDRGHINVILVLQSCTDPLHILPGSPIETYTASADGTCNSANIEVDGDAVVIEVVSIPINKGAHIGIKPEEIPEVRTFPDRKSEADEVSYLCMCVCVYY
jgi:hypothetical protein